MSLFVVSKEKSFHLGVCRPCEGAGQAPELHDASLMISRLCRMV